MKELSNFQRDLLFVVANPDYTTVPELTGEIQAYYAEGVDEERVERNLSKLQERGFIHETDGVGSYDLTVQGRELLEGRRAWEDSHDFTV